MQQNFFFESWLAEEPLDKRSVVGNNGRESHYPKLYLIVLPISFLFSSFQVFKCRSCLKSIHFDIRLFAKGSSQLRRRGVKVAWSTGRWTIDKLTPSTLRFVFRLPVMTKVCSFDTIGTEAFCSFYRFTEFSLYTGEKLLGW